jgi:hypothetical protein
MFKTQIIKINETIKNTKKAIISLGCSFTQGQGAISEDIYKNYNWMGHKFGQPSIEWDLSASDAARLTTEYPDITIHWFNGKAKLDFVRHEYDNAFVNVLCKKYFNGEYAPINLGQAGHGNRASIKELYFYPDILWDQIEECIVIYCPSGLERVDFMDDTQNQSANSHGRWTTMWPNEYDRGKPKGLLWQGYKESLHSMRFDVLEQIAHIQELMLWCKFKNAKLIVIPAFSNYYDKEHFSNSLCMGISREGDTGKIFNEFEIQQSSRIEQMVNMWPWDNMFSPLGCKTFSDLLTIQESPETPDKHFYTYISTGSPNGWITPCAHPAAKGHDLLASLLYKQITENLEQFKLNKRIGNF